MLKKFTYKTTFIHLSIDGHLGRFSILATSAAMNMGVHVFSELIFPFFRIYIQECNYWMI